MDFVFWVGFWTGIEHGIVGAGAPKFFKRFFCNVPGVTQKAGIHFIHNNAAFGKKYLPETMGPGVAFIDYDNDGWEDIFIVNGTDWPGHAQKHSTPKLYHNNHNGTFTGCNAQGWTRCGNVWYGRCGGRL